MARDGRNMRQCFGLDNLEFNITTAMMRKPQHEREEVELNQTPDKVGMFGSAL